MLPKQVFLTGNARHFSENEIIVSKTDLKGCITYVNDVFLRISDFSEKELLGQPHKIIRHAEMPRAIFKMLWDALKAEKEIFAYVVNRSKNGDHYWVLAHVTPSHNSAGEVIGYHSNRRVAKESILKENIIPLYKKMLIEEKKHDNNKNGLEASMQTVNNILTEKNMSVNEFILSL